MLCIMSSNITEKGKFQSTLPESRVLWNPWFITIPMNYRDSRKRIRRKEGGHVEYLLVRRMFCAHCHRLHVELPNCLVPQKHYDAEVISGVIEGVVTADDLDSEDHPCAMTMRRRIKWFLDKRKIARARRCVKRQKAQARRCVKRKIARACRCVIM